MHVQNHKEDMTILSHVVYYNQAFMTALKLLLYKVCCNLKDILLFQILCSCGMRCGE